MNQAYQQISSRQGTTRIRVLRFWLGIGLILAIGIGVSPEVWAWDVSPTGLTFYAVAGATNPPSQSIKVSQSRAVSNKYVVSDNRTWVTTSPSSWTMTTSQAVTVAVNTTGLAAGTYNATVTITLNSSETKTVPVTLMVSPATSSSTTTTATKTATIAWDPVTSTGLAGYKVYMGTVPGLYGTSFNVGNITSYIVNNLTVGRTYYFVVTAYNTSGMESLPSIEVSKTIN